MAVVVKVSRTSSSQWPLPSYQSEHAAGLDLVADLAHEVQLAPLARSAIPSGIAIELPPGYEAQVRPRSGRALRDGLTLVNAPGTIDADYRGEIQVLVINLGQEPVTIKPGERIAQLIIAPVAKATVVEVINLSESGRGRGGFGHTGS